MPIEAIQEGSILEIVMLLFSTSSLLFTSTENLTSVVLACVGVLRNH